MTVRRLSGILLIVAAGAGLVFSIVGLFELWRIRPGVTQTVTDTLTLFDQALTTTQDGLTSVDQEVQIATDDVSSLQTITKALAQSIHDTNPMLDSLNALLNKTLPDAIGATQTSLTSAQSSALLIDNALATLSSIPFLPLGTYKPEIPLHTALAQISTSLDSLTPALTTISTSLVAGKTSLGIVEDRLNNISDTTLQISAALSNARASIDQYQSVTTRLKLRLDAAQQAAPGWITTLTLILSFVLVWFLIAQVGLGWQGFDMLRPRHEVE